MGRRIPCLIALALLGSALIAPEAQAGNRYRGRSNRSNSGAQQAIKAELQYETAVIREQQAFMNGWAAEQAAARRRSQVAMSHREAAIAQIQARQAGQKPAKAPAVATPAPAPYPRAADASK